MSTTERVLELALETGFDQAGIAPLAPPPDLDRLERWLEAGRHAGLTWMERDLPRLADPSALLPGGRSILVVGLGHSRAPVEFEGGLRMARYAAGRDYHNVVGRRLRKLRARLVDEGLMRREQPFRKIVDAGPLLERSHAARAGLGFHSKAANLLSTTFGPWLFLGELLLELELEPTPRAPEGACGSCRLCLDACPTAAIVEPGVVDANLCLSYHTIESAEPLPDVLRTRLGGWTFGCDVCSEVCPWGEAAPDLAERFGTHALVEEGPLAWLDITDDSEFTARANGSPLTRPGRAGLARNVATALGNLPSDAGREALLASLERDPSALVREAAGDALARGHRADEGVLPALERALEREPDAHVRTRLAARLGA